MPGYISEVDYDGGAGSNFIEVAIPKGTDVSSYSLVIYDNDGTIIETFSFGTPTQTVAQQDVYLFDDNDPNWVNLHNNEAVALVDDTGTIIQFIAFASPVTAVEGPANGQSATQIGEHSGGDESLETADGGSSYGTTTTSTPGSIACFAPDTLIATPDGPRAVKDLRVGDKVMTEDSGPQPIRWIKRSEIALDAATGEGDAPVLFSANAIAPGLPGRDLILSPNHRVLLGGAGQFTGLLAGEALAPAKALACLPHVRRMRGRRRITWWHFALDRHAIVLAEGLRVESLLLGEMVLLGSSEIERAQLKRLYPGHKSDRYLNGPVARPLLSAQLTKKLLDVREVCALFDDRKRAADAKGRYQAG